MLRRLSRGEYYVQPDGFECESGEVVGVVYVLCEVVKRPGPDRAIGYSREAKLVQFLICGAWRLKQVRGEGATVISGSLARNHAMEEILGFGEFDEDDLHKALDCLSKCQERIE